MSNVRLRPVRLDDEVEFRAAHRSLLASDDFALGLDDYDKTPWVSYVPLLANNARGIDLPADRVPATFLVATVGEEIIGRSSIRHELNDFLAHEGGHIGYGVLQRHRRRGYATEILRQSLIIASSLGIDVALLTCDDSNLGSATVIERCGGVLRDKVTASDGILTRRYDITL